MESAKTRFVTAFLFVLGSLVPAGCSSSSTTASAPVSAKRSYNGTASVGDFLTIQIDSIAHTIAYTNHSNGVAGTVPYTVNANGSYTIADPSGNLVAAYEVPGYVMLVESNKSGSNMTTPALITAIETKPVTISSFAGQKFNYLQFRTSGGGLEVGYVSIDEQGSITHDGYSPVSVLDQQGQSAFNGGTFAASSVVEDSSGTFFSVNQSDGSSDHVFGTQNGFFTVDTGNGTILGLPQAASKAFDPTFAGSYKAILYQKTNAQTGQNNIESGTVTQDQGSITIGSTGAFTLTDSKNSALITGTLAAVADTSYLYDSTENTLTDPCNGLFTIRTSTTTSLQDVFVTFQGTSVIFGSFQTARPTVPGATYNYFYGVGLK
jgi:hypothetical protein